MSNTIYQKVDPTLDFVSREKAIGQFWKQNRIFQKSMEIREGCEAYTFYDGPPTANGKPHIGHVLTRVIKDMIPRYRAMKGYYVSRKAGWDTHGLPVELEVEKLLGLDGKEQIEQYGLAPFIEKCKESVWKYKGMWEDFSDTVGFWADMEDPYVTYDNNYIESEWWALKTIWDKGLLYKGFKIVPYCPRCGTPLSSHEVALGYKDVKERSAIVKFKLKDEEAYILAWTTTPWTLPSNLALCLNPKETYILAKLPDATLVYLAQALADSVLKDGYETIKSLMGKDLEYREYEPLFDFEIPLVAASGKKAFYVVCDDYVTLSDGTGVVHTAPAFGEDDSRVGRVYDLPFLQLVDSKGEMKPETPWAGVFVKDADKLILRDLKSAGMLFDAPVFEHNYPHCWRCDTPLIYYARESWFIKMTAVRDSLIRNNNTINWIPPSIGKGRFGDWLENVQDWGISRNRYWGTPLNIWECECGHQHSIGGIDELRKLSPNFVEGVELHRPYIDEITIACEKCGRQMKRVPEVIDCWFDSGAMPFAQYHYPFENKELFKDRYPASFISEAVDQTRGWFYSLLAESSLLFDNAPFKNVIVMGHVQDENGQKMSKSKGNAVDPFDALNKFGADAIRWYFYVNSAPWLPNRFHDKAVVEGQRKFLGTLWNTYAFFVLYANIDGFDANKYTLDYDGLPVMDKWVISKLNSCVALVDDSLFNYKIPEAARALLEFSDDLSNWYVRRCRERFWAKGMEADKINAYMTLYTCLVTIAKAAAPMIPFMSEMIYQNLVISPLASTPHLTEHEPLATTPVGAATCRPLVPESVHLCDFPTVNDAYIDKTLENDMDIVLKAVVQGRACRNTVNIKNRQPLAAMFIKSGHNLTEFFTDIIKEELNVKEVNFTDDIRAYTDYSFKPQLKSVGPKYGKLLGGIQKALSELKGNAAFDELNQNGAIKFSVNGEEVVLGKEDLLIATQHLEGFVSEADNNMAVVLDIRLNDALIEEGLVNEIISKLQTMRKEAGFEVMDKIFVNVSCENALISVIGKNEMAISQKVLAEKIYYNDGGFAEPDKKIVEKPYKKTWDIGGRAVTLEVCKI